ncbi:MAG TPA: hypothetical protein VJS37_17865 [Terriglobales bacterium]|nr:hypothetical protein [Terriglobales bacterium]
MTDSQRQFCLPLLEGDVLAAIDHVGWYAYLWFPIVQRDVLHFGSEDPDEEVHAAFASLIRKRALLKKPGEIPERTRAPGALETAGNTQSRTGPAGRRK